MWEKGKLEKTSDIFLFVSYQDKIFLFFFPFCIPISFTSFFFFFFEGKKGQAFFFLFNKVQKLDFKFAFMHKKAMSKINWVMQLMLDSLLLSFYIFSFLF